MSVLQITGKDFRGRVLEHAQPTLLLYYSPWNHDSMPQRAVLTELLPCAEQLQVQLAETNGDEEAELDAWFRIIDFPTAVLYRGGKELDRLTGAHTAAEYERFLRTALSRTPLRDTMPDTWTAIDRLGRALPGFAEVGGPRPEKTIAMFYFISYGENDPDPAKRYGPYDITKILREEPDAMNNPASPPWGPYGTVHFWGESAFGYYRSKDEYVIAKHAQLLGDAGVDVIIFDVSNFQHTDPPGAYFYDTFMTVFRTFDRVRRQGRRTPQIAFLFNFWYGPYAVRQIYRDLYAKELYADLWFRWEGKPLVMFDKEKIPQQEQDLLEFFTFRRPMPDYFYGPQGPDQWAWCEIHPQHGFASARRPGEVEEVPVSVAQNAVPDAATPGGWTLGCMSQRDEDGRWLARGRSFCGGVQPREYHPELGANFDEQWARAYQLDPRLVFVTGWNEWVMGRMPQFIHEKAANVMVDQFNEEFSRDLEPSRTVIGDNAYYQFAAHARRFKGVRQAPRSTGRRTIDLHAGVEQWESVGPAYLDDIGDVEHRCCEGWGLSGTYRDDSGRNDLACMKVCRDTGNLYFLAQCAAPLTPCTDELWMNLLLRTTVHRPAWESFQWLVRPDAEGRMTLYRSRGGWNWQPVQAVEYAVHGDSLMLSLSLSVLELSADGVELDFKWCDNVPLGQDEYGLEFYTHGDTAPNGRFCYHYAEKYKLDK